MHTSALRGTVAKERKKNSKEPDEEEGRENAAGGWDRRGRESWEERLALPRQSKRPSHVLLHPGRTSFNVTLTSGTRNGIHGH